ncbi:MULTISPECIES: putative zinc ribbon protein [Enterobacter]|uniref:putative zinc ribbon protein n=2 Tax=Enterobacteriaceae TaxID=543 RepID=UPI00358DB872
MEVLMSTRMTVALTGKGHCISAESARRHPTGQYFCLHCQCLLLVCGVSPYQSAYFLHDPLHLTPESLECCPDADIPARKESPHRTPVTWWHCLLCHRHYYGNKRCSVCHSGDHSIQA